MRITVGDCPFDGDPAEGGGLLQPPAAEQGQVFNLTPPCSMMCYIGIRIISFHCQRKHKSFHFHFHLNADVFFFVVLLLLICHSCVVEA